MPPSKEAQKIASAFAKYAATGDKSLIEKYKLEDIEIALIQYSADERFPHYSAMKVRINELKEKKKNIEKWKDRIIGSVFTIIIGLILYFLTKLFGS